MKNRLLSLFFLPLILALFTVKEVNGQTPTPSPPDCVVYLNNLTAATSVPSGNGFDNRFIGCMFWTLQYQSVGFTALSLAFQSSVGSVTPTAFGAYTGTTATGVNPNTNTAGRISTFTNGVIDTPWVRVNLSGLMGAGTLNGVLYGYKSGYPGATANIVVNGTCPGDAGTPCVVEGVTAAGSPPANPPVLVAGQDGTNIQTIKTDTNGQEIPANAAIAGVDAVSNTPATPTGAAAAQLYNRNLPYIFNGSTNDRQFNCPNQAVVTFTAASGSVQIVGLTGGQIIRICHVSLASDALTDITFQYGTGSNCGTGTNTIAGPYKNVTALSFTFGPESALRTIASNEFCINSSATVTIGGVVTYAKY